MPLIYKTLFEVKLMHEYFITDVNGQAMFDEPIQKKRMQFLLSAFTNDRESIDRDLEAVFTDDFRQEAGNYYLKLIPAYSGFKVGIRVNPKLMPDGSLFFEPFAAVPDDLVIAIQWIKKNKAIEQYTNSRIDRPLPSIYFFSNENIAGIKTFPYLSNAVRPMQLNYDYEQGELAMTGPDTVEFYKDETGA